LRGIIAPSRLLGGLFACTEMISVIVRPRIKTIRGPLPLPKLRSGGAPSGTYWNQRIAAASPRGSTTAPTSDETASGANGGATKLRSAAVRVPSHFTRLLVALLVALQCAVRWFRVGPAIVPDSKADRQCALGGVSASIAANHSRHLASTLFPLGMTLGWRRAAAQALRSAGGRGCSHDLCSISAPQRC
jgi:hypothetical protein